MWYDYGYGWAGHPHFFHGPISLIGILLLILLAVFVVRLFVKGRHKHGCDTYDRRSEALTLLETRYVQGEIDRDEFLKKKSDLLNDVPSPKH